MVRHRLGTLMYVRERVKKAHGSARRNVARPGKGRPGAIAAASRTIYNQTTVRGVGDWGILGG